MLAACGARDDAPRPATATAAASQPAPPSPAPPDAPIRTDRASYALTAGPQGLEATIVATLRAPADRPIYLLNCNGATGANLQRQTSEGWVYAWVIAMNACLSPPIVVPPGGERTTRIYVHENSGAVLDPADSRMIVSGTYRVVWTGVLTSFDPNAKGFGEELPLEQRVSAPFHIDVPR
jgi:hypothetical protein